MFFLCELIYLLLMANIPSLGVAFRTIGEGLHPTPTRTKRKQSNTSGPYKIEIYFGWLEKNMVESQKNHLHKSP